MKFAHLFLILPFAALAGCSSQGEGASQRPDPNVGLTAEQKIDKIKSDPTIPDGLKRIQTETLQRQAGIKP